VLFWGLRVRRGANLTACSWWLVGETSEGQGVDNNGRGREEGVFC
jgi:hypothetical protein